MLLWLHERTDISNNISNNIYVGNPVQFVIDVQAMQAADQTLWKSSAAVRHVDGVRGSSHGASGPRTEAQKTR